MLLVVLWKLNQFQDPESTVLYKAIAISHYNYTYSSHMNPTPLAKSQSQVQS